MCNYCRGLYGKVENSIEKTGQKAAHCIDR